MPVAAGPFDLGDPVLLNFSLTDVTNAPVNTSITPICIVTLPDQTVATPTVTNPSTGLYTATYATAQVGHHTVAWAATGTNPGGLADSFDVWPTADRSILSFADCKASVELPASVVNFDPALRQVNEAVTDFVEYYCGPVCRQTITERLRSGGMTVALSSPPVLSLTNWPGTTSPMKAIRTYGVTYDLSMLYVDPFSGIVEHIAGLPFFYGPYIWSYTAGRTVIPMGISEGARIIVKHLWARKRGGGGGAFVGAEEETSFEGFGFAVPNAALEVLEPYRSPGVAV